jgi:putative sigma-54 modulation protein
VSISTRHGHLSEATQDKLRAKAEKLGRFFDRLMAIEIVVDLKDSAAPKVDVNVSAEHKHDFVAHEQADNLWAAVDAATSKIEQQLRKYKERVQERSRNPEARRTADVVPAVTDDDEAVDAEE